MKTSRRTFLKYGLASGSSLFSFPAFARDKWGESEGFPTGWGDAGKMQRWEGYPEYHVGNFTGGLEKMFLHKTIRASQSPLPVKANKRSIKARLFMDATDYANRYDRMGLLIARQDEIWHEQYRFQRTPDIRFFGFSMTKSVVGLMTGIALDQGKIESLDDRIEKYVDALRDHPFSDITLRNLLNMTSGINICEFFCTPNNGFERYGYSQIGYSPRRGQGTDQVKGILEFRWGRSDQQGTRFNYTDLCPVLMAWVLESVYKQPLPTLTEQLLWQPLGAESDATWLTDSKGFTFSAAGYSATLRDWARLGMLVANDGQAFGKQVVPKAWLDNTSTIGVRDQANRFGVARPGRGYKNYFWLQSGDGSVLRMEGNHAQTILIDRKSKTVMVQVAPGYVDGADQIMLEMFQSACKA